MKTTAKKGQSTSPEKIEVEFTNAYRLTGALLEPINLDAEAAQKHLTGKHIEKKFKSESELAQITFGNAQTLFGDKSILIDCAEKNSIVFPGGFIPHGLLFDLREAEQPRLYILEIMLEKENIVQLLKRMTNVFYFFKSNENTKLFADTLDKTIRSNIGWRNRLKPAFESKIPSEFLQQVFLRKPSVLLVMDKFKEDITPFMEAYTETWGKMIKPIRFRKFDVGDDTLFTMTPTFAELSIKSKGNAKEKKFKVTEEDHLEDASETVREIFLHMKAELLKADSNLEFKAKGYYIALRKKRNIAFFQLGRKKLSIVIANPEKGMREQIKHHAVRTLAESVKKFWNGNENCFTVVIERKEHLEEILDLLKKIVGVKKINGNEPASQEEDGKKQETKKLLNPKTKGKQKVSDKKPKKKYK